MPHGLMHVRDAMQTGVMIKTCCANSSHAQMQRLPRISELIAFYGLGHRVLSKSTYRKYCVQSNVGLSLEEVAAVQNHFIRPASCGSTRLTFLITHYLLRTNAIQLHVTPH